MFVMKPQYNDIAFNYVFLHRLISDCKYFLDHGNRQEKYLWAKDAFHHAELLKFVWGHLCSRHEEPLWIDEREIRAYVEKIAPDDGFRSSALLSHTGLPYCGNCRMPIDLDENGIAGSFCPVCGRKLDWFIIEEVYTNER